MQINIGTNNIYQPDYELERSKSITLNLTLYSHYFSTMLGLHFKI